jgi:hypothetical protein
MDPTIGFVFRQHKAVVDVLQCNDDDGIDNFYFFVPRRRRSKTFATIRANKYSTEKARDVITVSATSTCSRDIWYIDLELVGTRFHGSTIFHNHHTKHEIAA